MPSQNHFKICHICDIRPQTSTNFSGASYPPLSVMGGNSTENNQDAKPQGSVGNKLNIEHWMRPKTS